MLRDYLELPRSVHFLCLGTFVNRAGSFVGLFVPLYLTKELAYSESAATLSLGLFGTGSLLASLVGGHFADKIGRRPVLISSLFGGALLLVFLTTLTHPVAIGSCLFAFGFVSDMYRPAASTLIADLVPAESRGQAFGLMYVAINLGFACGALLGGEISGHIGFANLFLYDAATMAVYGLIVAWNIPESRPKLDLDQHQISAVEAMRRIAKDRVFLLFCFSIVLSSMAFHQGFATLSLFAKQHGFDHLYGRLIAVNGVLIVFLTLPVAAFLKGRNPMNALVVAFLLTGAGFGSFAFAETWPPVAFGIVLFTIGEILQAPFLSAVTADLAPVELRGRYQGLLGTSFAAGLAFGAPLGGLLLERAGGVALWSGTAFLCVLATSIILLIRSGVRERAGPRDR